MSHAKYILFSLIILSLNQVNSQVRLHDSIEVPPGSYLITDALGLIQERTNSLVFSSNKLPSSPVRVSGNETLGEFLAYLKTKKLISYEVIGEHLIISPYKVSKYTLKGVVKSASDGEHLIGANVHISGTEIGTIANGYGYYSLTLEEGDYQLVVSHIGFQNDTIDVSLRQYTHLNIGVNPEPYELESITINSLPADYNITSDIPSVSRLQINSRESQIPYLLGEADIIQNALLQPGILTTGENTSGLHIRGGDTDQNLVLLDEAIIYNPNHSALISIFNPEAINDVKIYKGFVPPSYGGRSSSVIEVRQKEGNKTRHSYSGGIGALSAHAVAEGPIKKEKASYLVSARQSLINPSISDFVSNSVRRNRFQFRDINLKINSRPNKLNSYYLSGYFGNDRNASGAFNNITNWGNRMINFRWNHLFGNKVFSNLSAFVSEYVYRVESAEEPGAFVSTSRIIDYNLKADLTYSFNPSNELNFGFSSVFHRLKPGDREPFDTDASTNTIRLDAEHGLESAFYISNRYKAGKFRFNYGLRYSLFHNLGPEQVRIYEPEQTLDDETVIDTLNFSRGETVKLHTNVEPRLSANYQLNDKTSIKAAFSKMAQYLHLISNTLSPSPTDIWKLSDIYIPPSVSNQYTLGLYKNLRNGMWESNLEVYYRDNLRQIDYKNGADLIFNENIETELLISRGRSYGAELFVAKKYGTLTGWLSYTLSRSENRLEENDNRTFVLNSFDRTHNFSTSWVYKFNKRINVSGNFIVSTGIPITLPSDKYQFGSNIVPLFGERNKSRLPTYHRLDLSFRLEGTKMRKNGKARKNRDYFVFTLYNVYARKNANTYFFRESENNPGIGEIVQYSFGTIWPGITYNFRF